MQSCMLCGCHSSDCGLNDAILDFMMQLSNSLRATGYPFVGLLAFSGSRTRLVLAIQVRAGIGPARDPDVHIPPRLFTRHACLHDWIILLQQALGSSCEPLRRLCTRMVT